jgi:ABC-type transport system substrate-binding protein
VWNPQQEKPATPWESEIDSLMRKQEVELDFKERRRLYLRLQQIEMQELPIISLVSPHVLIARGPRVHNLHPVVLDHYTLWNADELFVTGRSETGR